MKKVTIVDNLRQRNAAVWHDQHTKQLFYRTNDNLASLMLPIRGDNSLYLQHKAGRTMPFGIVRFIFRLWYS